MCYLIKCKARKAITVQAVGQVCTSCSHVSPKRQEDRSLVRCSFLLGPVVLGPVVLWSCGPVALWSCGHVVMWSCGFLGSNYFRLNLLPLKASPLATFFPSNRPGLSCCPFFFQFSFIFSRSREFAISP